MLTLHQVTLLNSIIHFYDLSIDSCGFSTYTIMLSMNNDRFISSFPIFILLISFPGFAALSRTSSIMLKRSRDNGYPCLTYNLRQKTLKILIKYDVCCAYCIYLLSHQGSFHLFLVF